MDGTTHARPAVHDLARRGIVADVGPRGTRAAEPADGHDPSPGDVAAPHVRAAVSAACAGDPVAVAEVLAALGAECRRGWRALPDPLPNVPSLAARSRSLLPPDLDPDRVLALALCGRGPLSVLHAITGGSADRIVSSRFGRLVEAHGWIFRFSDAALRTAVLAASTASVRLRAHRLLAAAYATAGDPDAALWHRARGSASGDPGFVEPLVAQSRVALRRGSLSRAWAHAEEAVAHARSGTPAHAAALLCAGHAALSGGWVVDALERIEGARRIDGAHRGDATAAYVLARTLRHGVVPAPAGLIPGDATSQGYRSAAVRGALLSAERGDHRRSAAWLAVGAGMEHDRGERSALQAWCDVLAGGSSTMTAGGGSASIAHALYLGLSGDPRAGLHALTETDALETEEICAGLPARAPMHRARRAVAEVLLHVWAGRIGIALDLLRAAADELPVALPFAGLAVALSRRLELAVDGRVGALSRDLEVCLPWVREGTGFVDRALGAFLQGRSDEAAVHMRLWSDRCGPPEPFALPGLDEIGPFGAPRAPEPPDATAARLLRQRVRKTRTSGWRDELDQIAAESRGIRSPFERARLEALLGPACAVRGDRSRAVRHLRAAQSLFDESGAQAWRGMVDRRLRMLDAPRHGTGRARDDVSTPVLEVCRATWETILTARELEVALLMAQGCMNREIALALHVSVRTVEVHGGRIFAKLGVRTRHELTVLAHRTEQHL
ncbi:helix-turn-helix domain-containing protein [Microbacterium azadirachtae]|uniref:helix-turn-helix domain-containing protein n=1 Tax=Microbacterium azadirachtae TaxID=582680 RepID=UPI00087E3D29|nr:helix-turn-helix transcriptional regulator [Microbacterium azadirachtae]SDL43966.1 regulatory protein, luxR family [Microbacterium azadirachtae]SEF74284.1 regulatory protein, luxR family [Microbacterium azadirachtae]SEF75041.1 regulatory protein, luxR family [Microbacterium azadirachtae]